MAHGRPGQLPAGLGADDPGRDLRAYRARHGSSGSAASSPPMTWSTGSSTACVPTNCGSPTSPNTPRGKGKLYCAAVLDAYSRRIVGWSIDSRQDSTLVVNALDMAIRNRRPEPGGIVHADHGVQFTSWAFGDKIRSAGLMPSFGSVGDGLDNAMMESFWSSMQIELLNRKTLEDPSRARQRDLRVHRDLPQPPTPPLRTRLPHPDRVRTTLRERPPSQPESHHRNWKPSRRAGQDVTYPCSRPHRLNGALTISPERRPQIRPSPPPGPKGRG